MRVLPIGQPISDALRVWNRLSFLVNIFEIAITFYQIIAACHQDRRFFANAVRVDCKSQIAAPKHDRWRTPKFVALNC